MPWKDKENQAVDERVKVVANAIQKCKKRYNEFLTIQQSLLSRRQAIEAATVPEIKKFLAVRKKKEDGAMPGNKSELLVMLASLKNREPLTLNQYLQDENKEVNLIDQALSSLTRTEEPEQEQGSAVEN